MHNIFFDDLVITCIFDCLRMGFVIKPMHPDVTLSVLPCIAFCESVVSNWQSSGCLTQTVECVSSFACTSCIVIHVDPAKSICEAGVCSFEIIPVLFGQ